MSTPDLDLLCINTIRTLSMDAVQAADSGHPGTPMALAPLGFKLFTEFLNHDPADPAWPNRDRFVLSCGHASMLLYSCLYLTGYDLSLDDLKQFRQWGSKTPGHPEHGHTPGVETTTGPLGQGLANAVGMALAESHLAARFNKPGHDVVDHHTYFICSDGDLMEGISHEAASFAGHFRLGKLIGFYDDNHITIDGATELTFTDDTARRFEAYGWQVLRIGDVNHLSQIDAAIDQARAESDRPTLIVTRTHIGFGSPHRQDTSKAHGEALGVEEVKLTKQNLGWLSLEPFFVPQPALERCRQARPRGAALHAEWNTRFDAYARAFPDDARELKRRLAGELPAGWEQQVPAFTKENGTVATRQASQAVLNALAPVIPELVGGSADLTPSNGTAIKSEHNYNGENPGGRYIHSGIREHAMARLEVGGLVTRPASLSLADLRALPSRTQITRHDCVEGWSAIAKWKGARLSALLETVQPKPEARFVVLYCADPMAEDGTDLYYESIDLEDAFHPQTILAYEMNDAALPVANGAPIRLRVERQLGYKHAKYVMRLELVQSFAAIAGGKGGYWEDQGYQWFAGI